MTYVSASVKDSVLAKPGILSRMTRSSYRRLAGVRFTHLIRQLQERDPAKWSIQAIADAIGCERSIVSKWHPDNVRQRREPPDRSGISDLIIQGIHDGLGVSSEYLFMPSHGFPKQITLKDGSTRPCEPDEIDHRLMPVSLDEHRQKVQLKEQGLMLHSQASELTALRQEFAEFRAMMRDVLGTLPSKSVK